MKIDSVFLYDVKPRWCFIRIVTDTGVEGWGELTLEGHAPAVRGAVECFKPVLIGADPLKINALWQRLYRGGFYRGGPVLLTAISGIEHALWDIRGKELDVPVYELLGGAVRDRIRMYSHAHGNSAEELAEDTKRLMKTGYTAVKSTMPGPIAPMASPSYNREVLKRFEAIRDTAGPDVGLAIDIHGRATPAQSLKIINLLEKLDMLFYEETSLPESFHTLESVRKSTNAPLATGERLYGKGSFFDLLSKDLVDVVQPDIAHAGGIQECRNVAVMAESRQVSVALHCPLGPVALAACLQLDAVMPNFLIQEHVTVGEGYLKEDLPLEDGYIKLSDKPGLGIDVDLAAVESHLLTGPWESPTWFLEDGSQADW